jgi:hypothetical protein
MKGNGFMRGYVDDKHFTEYVETVISLKRTDPVRAEELLRRLVEAAEDDVAGTNQQVAPWYYEQIAILRRKAKDAIGERSILERYSEVGGKKPKLLERLVKVTQ